MGLIYLTTNKINGRKYIGKQVNEKTKSYIGSGTALKSAIKKYGKENFEKEILESGIEDKKELCKKEIYYISQHNAQNSTEFYNITAGGEDAEHLYKTPWTEERRAKFKETVAIRNSKPEYREKLSLSLIGRPVSEETRRKISNACKGKPNKKLSKPVLQLDLDGNLIREFSSISEAEREIKARVVWAALQNENRVAKGYKWKYKNEQNLNERLNKYKFRNSSSIAKKK